MRQIHHVALLGIFLLMSCNSKEDKKADEQLLATSEVPKVVTADIEDGIKKNIAKKVEEGNGYFHLNHEDKELRLQLVRVHTEYLSTLGPRRHFACVDLADISGDVYDVDFFLDGDPGNMTVTETTLHKLNGKPYYTWKQRKDKTWYRLPLENASDDLLGVIQGDDHFTFNYQITLPGIKEKTKMWVPIPQNDAFQKIELLTFEAPVEYKILTDQEFGNSIAYMEFAPEHSGAKINFIYDVQREEKHPYEADIQPGEYLNATSLMPVGDRFEILADSIIGSNDTGGTIMQARALYDYVIDNMRYMKWGNYGRGDSIYACDVKSGNCTEFHSLFISLARSAGIPSRFAIGAAIPSDRNEGGIDGYHCWAEFYAEGKWWPVDISEANKYTALSTYYFGRHPANRIEFSKGRDLVVEPGPQTGIINFLAYPIIEVGHTPTVADTFFSFERISQ